ncbi:MAG: hypothetical protein VYE73_18660 [Acidobacteriota bacterium]|nr:hypothetical protein [Acidobacteriota bacterium]
MNISGCLDAPSRGHYRLGGVPVHTLTDDTLSELRNEEIGFVFQSFNLLPRLDAVHNAEVPLIYNDVPPEERLRVASARALVSKPSTLLADEPTGNLDFGTSKEIMELFDALSDSGTTVILVTHETSVAQHASRVIEISDGRLV